MNLEVQSCATPLDTQTKKTLSLYVIAIPLKAYYNIDIHKFMAYYYFSFIEWNIYLVKLKLANYFVKKIKCIFKSKLIKYKERFKLQVPIIQGWIFLVLNKQERIIASNFEINR